MVDKDRIAGSAKEVTGAVKLESQGAAEKTEGKIQNAVGGVKDTIKDTSKAAKH
jgi:uncharacterized protein YjbJ (UPF0337 family)